MSPVQFPAGGLGVAFFATGPGRVFLTLLHLSDTRIYLTLKNRSVDNQCKCQILYVIYPVYDITCVAGVTCRFGWAGGDLKVTPAVNSFVLKNAPNKRCGRALCKQ